MIVFLSTKTQNKIDSQALVLASTGREVAITESFPGDISPGRDIFPHYMFREKSPCALALPWNTLPPPVSILEAKTCASPPLMPWIVLNVFPYTVRASIASRSWVRVSQRTLWLVSSISFVHSHSWLDTATKPGSCSSRNLVIPIWSPWIPRFPYALKIDELLGTICSLLRICLHQVLLEKSVTLPRPVMASSSKKQNILIGFFPSCWRALSIVWNSCCRLASISEPGLKTSTISTAVFRKILDNLVKIPAHCARSDPAWGVPKNAIADVYSRRSFKYFSAAPRDKSNAWIGVNASYPDVPVAWLPVHRQGPQGCGQ